MPKEKQYKWKGRFVTKRVYQAMTARSENALNRLRKLKSHQQEEEADRKRACVEGNRIIDWNYVAEQMYCKSCKHGLHMENVEKETMRGLGSIFRVRCQDCLFVNTVKTGKEFINPSSGKPVFSINTKIALEAIHTGTGQSQLHDLFTILDLPTINSQVYKKHERIVGPVIELLAKESCAEATAMERVLTEESIDELKKLLPPELQDGFLIVNSEECDGETIVRIFASYDMGWSQRGNGHTYDSLNGYCALIGLKTGKVLDYCTRNRKCKICDSELHTGTRKPHDCRKNFVGSAKAMEADGAVQLVLKSRILREAKVQVGVFIGDNDSSSISAIQEAADHTILKQSDMNHSTKNVGGYMHNIHKEIEEDPEKELSTDIVKHIQRCFSFAVHQNKGDVVGIQKALINIPEHLFDNHLNCGEWCRNDSENSCGIRLKNSSLYESLKKLFTELAEEAYKFASAASSQANESLNHSMCSKARKDVSHSTSESCDFRFAATINQKNKGKTYLSGVLDYFDVEYLTDKFNKLAEDYNKIMESRKEKCSRPDYKKRRLDNKMRRAQLRNQKESSEGLTYKSGMTLIEKTKPTNVNCVQILDLSKPYKYENKTLAIIFFDLETSSLKDNCDILQISMKCHQYALNIYITPCQAIQSSATKVNGFTKCHKKLFQHGQEVPSISKKEASKKIIEFFQLFEKKCILVAHNCNFDSTRFLNMFKSLSLLELSEEYIYGFCDSLQMFRIKYPKKESGYKLTTLAAEQSLPCDGAHDAQFDVTLLEQLCLQNFELTDITAASKTIYQVMDAMHTSEVTKKLLPSYKPMKGVLSTSMQKKLASNGICYEQILNTFKTEGPEKTKLLLQNKINGCPTIMKTQQPIKKVIDYLQNL